MSEAEFAEHQKELFRLFEIGSIDDIHALIDNVESEFPEKLDKTSFWKACVYSIQGMHEEAIMILEKALKKGCWWNPESLAGDPDLQSLHQLQLFKDIIKKCEFRFENEKRSSRPEFFVYGNQNSDIGIFSLHWKASNVKEFSSYWLDNYTIANFLFGFPQSSQVYGFQSYCWDQKDKAVVEISNIFSEFRKKHENKQFIIAGASQGGTLALELALKRNAFDTKGFVAVIPAIREVSSIESLLRSSDIGCIKGCIITGDQDPFFEKTMELKPILESHGIDCKFIIKKGLGHYFPEDFPKVLTQAVNFIFNNSRK